MSYFSTNYQCEVVLWLAVTVFTINCGTVLTQPPHARTHYVRGNNNRDQSSERQDKQFPFNNNPGQQFHNTNGRQNFPYANNPAQQIFDSIKSNFEQNSNFQYGNQGNFNGGNMPFANNFADLAQNTYNIFNKTIESFNKFSNGNFGNFNQFIPSPTPNFNNGGTDGGITRPPPRTTQTVPLTPPPPPRTTPTAAVTPRIPVTPVTHDSDHTAEQNNFKTTTSKSVEDNVSHYIEGFPVILLKPNEIRK